MSLSIRGYAHVSDDLKPLRRVIAQLADHCGVDIDDRSAIRQLMDGDFSQREAQGPDSKACQELRTMLTLLFRLEASSSEDLGIAGLHRLWHQHSEILARFYLREPMQ